MAEEHKLYSLVIREIGFTPEEIVKNVRPDLRSPLAIAESSP